MFKDITNMVERLELFEERMGISIEGLYAVVNTYNDGTHLVIVQGEVHSSSGPQLGQDVMLVVAVYDSLGRLVGHQMESIQKSEFYGFHTFRIALETHIEPAKTRIFPQSS